MIPTIIPVQNFEIIRDQIALVLNTEFTNQVNQFYNTKCANISIFADRTVPLDKSENASIIISTFKGKPELISLGICDGPVEYLIRIVANSPTIGTERGDKLSAIRLQQLVGIVRYILTHPVYVNLGLAPGYFSHLPEISHFEIDVKDVPIDGTSESEAVLIYRVFIQENSDVADGIVLTSSDNNVRIELTEQGYKYNFQ